MKNIFKSFAAIALACSGALVSCDTEAVGAIYEDATESAALSFPSDQLIYEIVAEDNGVVKVPVYRGNTNGTTTVNISIDEATAEAGVFELVSETLNFADGESTQYAELNFGSIDNLGATEKYNVTLTIADSASISPTGVQSIKLAIQRKLTWEYLGVGAYYSELFGAAWEQPVEKAKEGNVYRLPDCIYEGYPLVFSLSEDGQTLTGWDPQPIGYTDATYGMLYFSPESMTRVDNTLSFPMYGLVIWNGGFAALYSGFTETVVLPSAE